MNPLPGVIPTQLPPPWVESSLGGLKLSYLITVRFLRIKSFICQGHLGFRINTEVDQGIESS